jgi:hypothetical protein
MKSAGGRRVRPTTSVTVLTVVVMAFDLVVTGAVIAHTVQTRQWLLLTLAWVTWSGHPGSSIRPGLVVAGLLGWFVGPAVGLVHLAGLGFEVWWARAERMALWGRTGVRLTLAEHRRQIRWSKGRMARLSMLRQQAALARRLPAG